jgi:alkanesulfonate monooxygenase SsuD/methylene tetrahydromethanopterin reductase-like flavin-dependent oxidoreductase (luciferase family)
MAATLQQVSEGRLLLGLGAGATPSMAYAREQEAIGMTVSNDRARAERVAETVQVLRRLWSGDASSFAGAQFRLDRPSGYLRADPPPPIIVGGFGPRMAGIAGRHGDGFNTQAHHPRLADLVRLARDEHGASPRAASPFIVTVFAGLDERWLKSGSRARQSLEGIGVDRLILLVSPPFAPTEIRAAGKLLAPTSSR